MPKRELPAAQEPEKRHKALPFSIESIMQSAGDLSGPAAARAESPSLSGSSSAGSSPAPSARSPTSSDGSADYSRVSTPISPGCNAGSGATPTASEGAGGPAPARGKRGSSSCNAWSKERINPLLRPQVCRDARLAPFECHLDNLELWHRFHPLDTEMIITKQGRRMFPPVRVTFSLGGGNSSQQQQLTGPPLNPRDKYQVLMDILPYDEKRYRYAYHKSSWQQAGKADTPSPARLFLHPDGPFTLDQLKRQVISFEKIKLTNNDQSKHGYIVLNSMHKYQPRIHLVLWRGKDSQNLVNAPVDQLDQETHKTFIFSETIFTAVTAYQNHSITKLKIDSNPFAKGFRDSSRLTDLELESMQDLMSDGKCPFSPPLPPQQAFPHFLFSNNSAGQPAGGCSNFEQLVMQQQQQFAAAMAAAGAHHPLHSLFGQLPGCGAPPPAPPQPARSSPARCQLSPIGRQPASGPQPGPPPSYAPAPMGGAAAHLGAFHPSHLQAVMAAHHQHQIAALSMQLGEQAAASQRQVAAAIAAAAAQQATARQYKKSEQPGSGSSAD